MSKPASIAPTGKTREVSFSWFYKTMSRFTTYYVELALIGMAVRLLGLVEPFVFQVIIDRVIPYAREATLIVVIIIFAIVTVFQGVSVCQNDNCCSTTYAVSSPCVRLIWSLSS